jgi:biopolymer transport protein ExbD
MRIRSRLQAGVKLDMTPMIDIVFQLLVFFAMTLKVASLEGDLAMLPPAREGQSQSPPLVPPIVVALRADEQGGLRAVELNGRAVASIAALQGEVERAIGGDPALAAVAEARLACDEHLAYEHTIAAVTALTGKRLASGEIQPLIGKVRLIK